MDSMIPPFLYFFALACPQTCHLKICPPFFFFLSFLLSKLLSSSKGLLLVSGRPQQVAFLHLESFCVFSFLPFAQLFTRHFVYECPDFFDLSIGCLQFFPTSRSCPSCSSCFHFSYAFMLLLYKSLTSLTPKCSMLSSTFPHIL